MKKIRKASISDLPSIRALLESSNLPADDVEVHLNHFYVAQDDGKIIGASGLEGCGDGAALLRSFAVTPEYRNLGIGKQLYQHVIEYAQELGISSLYLLTTTAQGYFSNLGFTLLPREKAPGSIQRTRQFSESCPSSAALMFKPLMQEGDLPSGSPEEEARKLFESGYYCAESVLMAVAKHHGIESPLIPSIATGFCSGIARTSGMCGALTGGILALNLLYGRHNAEETVTRNYEAVQKLIEGFRSSHGSTNCSELLGCHLGTPEGQKTFREKKLHGRCLNFAVTATRLAVTLSDEKKVP